MVFLKLENPKGNIEALSDGQRESRASIEEEGLCDTVIFCADLSKFWCIEIN